MQPTIQRNMLLERLVRAKHDGFVKIITGIRRCGKSYLLFNLFRRHLAESGVAPDHVVAVDLESDGNETLRSPIELSRWIKSHIAADGTWHYVLIDEIQLCRRVLAPGVDISRVHPDDRADAYIDFYSVLSALKNMPFVDVYVTGSNSRMLSSDVATQFRGRGEVIHVTPLSFAEFHSLRNATEPNPSRILQEYLVFGGMPECALMDGEDRKKAYLAGLYDAIYIRDITQRYRLHGDAILNAVCDVTMSGIGTLSNPKRIADTIQTVQKIPCSPATVAKHLDFLCDAFLVSRASRFDVRGRRHLDYPLKYYAVDTGLRNARTNFRQIEWTHLVENTIYCELVRRGYSVDVGVVSLESRKGGKHTRTTHEIDFVVNRGDSRVYIQSAWQIPDGEKLAQETFSLMHTGDSFTKVIIDGSPFAYSHTDTDGIRHIGLIDFLLGESVL